MDYTEYVSVALALGICWSMLYSRKTGWGCGGLITPGLLALKASAPIPLAGALLLGALIALLLKGASKFFLLYGRERTAVALLLALALRLIFKGEGSLEAFWIGWAAPGLIAADADRQGVAITLVSALSCTLVTAMSLSLIGQLLRVLQ